MERGAHDHMRHIHLPANIGKALILLAVRTAVRANNDPTAFFAQLRYPFEIRHTLWELRKEMRNLSVGPVKLQRIADLSLYYKVAQALIKEEPDWLCHAAGGDR
jgi:hypothetical protein